MMFDANDKILPKQKAVVIHPELKQRSRDKNDIDILRNPEAKLDEAIGLALAINLEVVLSEIVNLHEVSPASFLKGGKIEEIRCFVEENKVDLVIINKQITPVQQRNLEEKLKTKVIDRTALILEIFGKRAQTKEGQLQVELAACEYQKSRLVRSWTHLERQRGGGGFLGGPGERQIESDRRALNEKIIIIKRQLARITKTRELHRKSRNKIPYQLVSLVGYTNAGKSTLFNYITKESVLAENMLFATLDPKIRLIKLPSGKKILISDTVGFISDLPTELVAAFRATLEEVLAADILLHVRDAASIETREQKKDVLKVLEELGADNKAIIEVMNKADLLDNSQAGNTEYKVNISALTGDGVPNLLQMLDKILDKDNLKISIVVNVTDGKLMAWIYEHTTVLEERQTEDSIVFSATINAKNMGLLKKTGHKFRIIK